VVGDELQRCRSGFRDLAGNRNTKIAAAAIRCHEAKNILQRDTFAAKNVAMSDLPTFHGQNQARCNVAHVDKVDDEIKIQLKAPIEKVPQHRYRRSKVVIVRSDGHGWSADDHWKPRRRGLHRELFREHLGSGIWARHGVDRPQNVLRTGLHRWRRAKKDGLGRAVQESRNAALARGRNDDLCATAIDGMKIAFVSHPHAGKTGKMINLFDAVQGFPHPVRIEHRTFDILNFRLDAGRRVEIENTHQLTARDQRRYEVLSDESAAAGNEYRSHECGCDLP